jgi:hypothetical protein
MLGEIIDESMGNQIKIKNRFDQVITIEKEKLLFDPAEAEKIANKYNKKNKKKKPDLRSINKDIPLSINNFIGFGHILEGIIIAVLLLMHPSDDPKFYLFCGAAAVSFIIGFNLFRLAHWAWFASVIFWLAQITITVISMYQTSTFSNFKIRDTLFIIYPIVFLRYLFYSRDNFRK